MPRCPNCFYELVLFEKRRRYKCAKCSKLFPKREIEDKEFVEWNKKRKKELKDNLKRKKLSEEEKKKRAREVRRRWRLNHPIIDREKFRARQREYYSKNKDELNTKKREYWARNREHLLEKRRENYKKKKHLFHAQEKVYIGKIIKLFQG